MTLLPHPVVFSVPLHLLALECGEDDHREALELRPRVLPLSGQVAQAGDAMQQVAIKEDDVLRPIGEVKEAIDEEEAPSGRTAPPLAVHELGGALPKDEGRKRAGHVTGHVMVRARLGGALVEQEGRHLQIGLVVNALDHLSTPGTGTGQVRVRQIICSVT